MKRIAWVALGWMIPLICNATTEGIIDYKPSVFSEQAAMPFFFSMGKKLKYGSAIKEDAPTLFEAGLFDGDINEVYPSPDQKKAVVVIGNCLYLAQTGKPTTKLLQPFKLWNMRDLQWDSQSRYIFVPLEAGYLVSATLTVSYVSKTTCHEGLLYGGVMRCYLPAIC
jgi:hypothetical protein